MGRKIAAQKDFMELAIRTRRSFAEVKYPNMLLREVQCTHSSFYHRRRDGIREKSSTHIAVDLTF